jgi:hypothetical protein
MAPRYDWESAEAAKKLRKKVAEYQDRPIGGKPAVMREPLGGNDKAASEAYDAVQNIRESEAETLETRAKRGINSGELGKKWSKTFKKD